MTPFIEHACYFPYCPYIRFVKGHAFIRDHYPEYRTEMDSLFYTNMQSINNSCCSLTMGSKICEQQRQRQQQQQAMECTTIAGDVLLENTNSLKVWYLHVPFSTHLLTYREIAIPITGMPAPPLGIHNTSTPKRVREEQIYKLC